jgi:hypothetical protein
MISACTPTLGRISWLSLAAVLGLGLGPARAGVITPYNLFSAGFDQASTNTAGGFISIFNHSDSTSTFNQLGRLRDSSSSPPDYQSAVCDILFGVGGSGTFPLTASTTSRSSGSTTSTSGSNVAVSASGLATGNFSLAGTIRATVTIDAGVDTTDPGALGGNLATAQAFLQNVDTGAVLGTASVQIRNGVGNLVDTFMARLTLPAGHYAFSATAEADGSSLSSGSVEQNSQDASALVSLTNVQTLPEPPALLLLAGAGLVLAAARWRRPCPTA